MSASTWTWTETRSATPVLQDRIPSVEELALTTGRNFPPASLLPMNSSFLRFENFVVTPVLLRQTARRKAGCRKGSTWPPRAETALPRWCTLQIWLRRDQSPLSTSTSIERASLTSRFVERRLRVLTSNRWFQVQNSQCQAVHNRDSDRYPSHTTGNDWKLMHLKLKSGLNTLMWRVMGMHLQQGASSGISKPVLIKSIEVNGERVCSHFVHR